MSNNVLPNLSEWFEVPKGATIPEGTTWVLVYQDGSFASFNFGTNISDHTPETKAYTEKPIEAPKKTLEDVIRDAGTSVTDIAKAVEAFYAEQKPEQPSVIIDAGADEWRLNAKGTYYIWYGDENTSELLVGYTRERIEKSYGIKEERY